MKRIYILIIILCAFFKHGNSQDKDLKIDIPNQGIVGSDITVKLVYHTDFEYIIEQSEEFEFITKTEQTASVTQNNLPETKNYYIKELKFRCQKNGLFDFPQISIIANNDTLISDLKKVYVIDLANNEKRDSSLNHEIVFLKKIQEYIKDEDILIDLQYDKHQLHVNDTLTVSVKVLSRLENQIQPVDILNLRQEKLKIEFIPQQINDEKNTINGLLYREASSFNLRIIPKEKGYYTFDNVLISLKISFKKGKSMAYLMPNDYKEINLKIDYFDIKVKK